MIEFRKIQREPRGFILPFAVGLVAYFVFFAGFFNGDQIFIGAGVTLLLVNGLVSYLFAQQNLSDGVAASLAFAAPALFFALLGLGDAIFNGDYAPLLFWLLAGVSVSAIGFSGVFLASRLQKR